MKINKLRITNFRGYQHKCEIEFGELTSVIGKNDIGKSSILEALDIFFNKSKGVIKLDKDDVNKQCLAEGNNEIEIAVLFTDLPEQIIIDSTNQTTLADEYLLNSNNELEIIKRYKNGGTEKVFINANHPSNDNCSELLLKTQKQLQNIIADKEIPCDNRTLNAEMRTSIWRHYSEELVFSEIEIDVTKGDTKSIWNKLEGYLPLFSLFQSDRKNSDGDSEVQDPLSQAVKEIMDDEQIKTSLASVAEIVEKKLKTVAGMTLEKLREMNPEVADSLNPVIPSSDSLKWNDVFKKVTISGDENIPINKRGSGVKRLILLNFFRAEADRRRVENDVSSIIYAIEEPETAQHTEHQKMLIRALLDLSANENTQVLITTHSPVIVKELDFDKLRLIRTEDNQKVVITVSPNQLPYPSLNEVNYAAFNEITEEYHNELYGYIESEGHFTNYKNGKATMPYIRMNRNGTTFEEQKVLTEYIRHQIHHPENTSNERFTYSQLEDSINQMREYIQTEML